jgi:single-stranded DNA-specific DHH superfamily exonuclease
MATEAQNNSLSIETLKSIVPEVRLSDNLGIMDSIQLLSKEDAFTLVVGSSIRCRTAAYILEKFYATISPSTVISIEHSDKPDFLEAGGMEIPLSENCSASEIAYSVYDFYTSKGDTTHEDVIQANNLLASAMLSYLKSGKRTLDELVHHCAKELNMNNMALFFKGITELPYEGNPDYQILDTIVYAGEKSTIPDVTDQKTWYANDFYEYDPEMFVDFIREKKTGRIMPELSAVYVNHHAMCSFFPAMVDNSGTLLSPFTEKLRQSLETLVRVSMVSDYTNPENYTIVMNALEKVEIDNPKDEIIQRAVSDIKGEITSEYTKAHGAHEQENVEYVTLNDLFNYVKEVEARTEEPKAVTQQIWQIAALISDKAINSNRPIKILTDYDADGICFAYIMDKTLHKLNPNIELEVTCNDRRGSYGVPKNVTPEPDTIYIIGDMGCNELPYIENNFSEHIVIDHHLIEDEAVKEKFNTNKNLLNPHSLSCKDGKSAEYCATGLAYRVCSSLISAYEEDIARCNSILHIVGQQLRNHSTNYDIFKQACSERGVTLVESLDNPAILTASINHRSICNIDISGRGSGEPMSIAGVTTIPSHEGIAAIRLPYNAEKGYIDSPFDEKYRNSIDIIAGIGTIADCVNVLDEHSLNREIIKNAMKKIDNATQTNIDYILGCILTIANIGTEEVTAKKIGFNVAPFFNAPSRMSPVIEKNGAQMMYDILSSDKSLYSLLGLTELSEINNARKSMKNAIKDDKYYAFVESQRFGEGREDKVAIYLLPKEVPHTMCGIIAGNLAEACDKPAIVFTPKVNEKTKETTYVGSGRNVSRMTSLKAFIDRALSQADPEQLTVSYGGHEDAIGISSLNDLSAFEQVIKRCQNEFAEKDNKPVLLAINASDISKPETLKQILALEPLGQGFKLPPVVIEGKEERRTQLFKGNNPHWKTVRVAGAPDITDWDYSPSAYPTDKTGIIRTLAELEVSDFNGKHIEAKALFNQALITEREKELGKDVKSAQTISKE